MDGADACQDDGTVRKADGHVDSATVVIDPKLPRNIQHALARAS